MKLKTNSVSFTLKPHLYAAKNCKPPPPSPCMESPIALDLYFSIYFVRRYEERSP